MNPSSRLRSALLLLLALSSGLRAETDLEKATRLLKASAFLEAQALLEKTVQAEPRNAEAWCLMGQLQLATKNPAKAIEYADKAIQLDPTKARYHLLRGRGFGLRINQVNVLRQLSIANAWRGALEKAVQVEPRNREARFALFNYYFNAPGIAGGGLDKARVFAQQTLALDASRGHYLAGRVLQKEKNPGAAQAEYRLAQAADPLFASVYNELGYVELEMKQLDPALEHFRKQAELDPDNANSFDSLGDGLMAKGLKDEAITAYRKALALDPKFSASQRHLGAALEQAGRRDEAIQHYRQCAQQWSQAGVPAAVAECKARLKALGVKE